MIRDPASPLDTMDLQHRTGWRVFAFEEVKSSNDEAARLRDAGATDRIVVVANRQTEGRGRGGHRFASPAGGLYASLLVRARPAWMPGALVAAVSVALAEAVEESVGSPVQVKWPNDLWIEGKKVAGILLEASLPVAGERSGAITVVVGVGVNVREVPTDLPPSVRAATSALDLHARSPVDRGVLLARFLARLDDRLGDLETEGGRIGLQGAYRRRLALLGEPIRFLVGAEERRGLLRDASISKGLCVEGPDGVERWLSLGHVREVRPAAGGPP